MRGTWALTLGQWQRLPGSPGQSTGPSRAPGTSSPPPWVEGSLVGVEGLGIGGRASANRAVAELARRVGPRSHLLARGCSWRGGAWAGLGAGDQGPGRGPRGVRLAHAPVEGWRERMMNQGGGCRAQHPAHESLTLLGKEGWGGKTILA